MPVQTYLGYRYSNFRGGWTLINTDLVGIEVKHLHPAISKLSDTRVTSLKDG